MDSNINPESNCQPNQPIIDFLNFINTQRDYLDDITVDLVKLETLISVALDSEALNLSKPILYEYFYILDTFIKSADKHVSASLNYLNSLSKTLSKRAEARYL